MINQDKNEDSEPFSREEGKSTSESKENNNDEDKNHEELLPPSKGLSTEEANKLREKYGRNELPKKKTPGWLIFAKCLWGPMPIALWIAIIIEFALKNWPDGAILLFIQLANATIGWYETTKAGDAVAALESSLKPLATCFRDGNWQNMEAALLVPGDLVKLASGSAIPADCTINEGQIDVDEAALTGESLPVTMTPEHMPKMGSTVVRGEVDGTVQFTGLHTFFGKTALLIGSVQSDLGNIHYVLVKIMYGLTGLSALLCIIVFIYLMVHYKEGFKETLEFTIVLLVVSIPIAIEIVVTTTLALGSKELSKHKVIVTRLTSIEMMSAVNMLCSDKTGTLTQNKMQIQEKCYTFDDENTLESVLVLAALAAKWREPPRDALDTMVLKSADLNKCDTFEQLEYIPFDPRLKRTEATLKCKETGKIFKVTKGAPNIVLSLCKNKDDLRDEIDKIVLDMGERGIRCLCVAKTLERNNVEGADEWYMSGIMTFLDPPRFDTKETIAKSKIYGVAVKMITGDSLPIAKEMARMLDMDTNILTPAGLPSFPESGDPKDIPNTLGRDYGEHMLSCGGFAHVFPEHKFLIVETLRQCGFTCAMTGDGVNDAPALKRADVGIAVEGATDAARAAADMVLTNPGLSVVVDAMLIARGVFQRMVSFLTYRISATLQLVCFFFLGVFLMPCHDYGIHDPDFQFFRLPVLLFMLITLLNDGTLMTIGYDNVRFAQRPQRWNLPVVFLISAIMSLVALLSSLWLLWMAMNAVDENLYKDSWFKKMKIPRIEQGPFFFYQSIPSKILMIGATISLLVSTFIAAFFHRTVLSKTEIVGLSRNSFMPSKLMPLWVWIYCIFFWLIQDVVKVGSYKLLNKYDILSYRTKAESTSKAAEDIVRRPSVGGRRPSVIGGRTARSRNNSLIEGKNQKGQ